MRFFPRRVCRAFRPRPVCRAFRPRCLRRRLCLGLLALLLTSVLLLHFRYLPAVRRLASAQVSNETSNRISEAVAACIERQNLSYTDLVRFERTDDGAVAAVQWDMVRVNRLRSDLLSELGRLIPDLDARSLGIPAGNVFFPALLSGRGGRLPVRVVSLRGAGAELQSSFTRAGVNQTLHVLELQVSVEVLLFTPAGFQTCEVSTGVPVAQTVIVGAVPDTLLTIGE